MSAVNKQEPGLFVLRDEYVRQVSDIVSDRDDPEKLAAAEIALMELALGDLDRNKQRIETQWEMYNRNVTKKFARAYAKTILGDISKASDPVKAAEDKTLSDLARSQWVKAHTRAGKAVRGYFRSLAEGEEQTPETKEAIAEVRRQRRAERAERLEPAVASGEGGFLRRAWESVRGVAEEARVSGPSAEEVSASGTEAAWAVESAAESLVKGQEGWAGAAKAFLKENKLTQGVVSVADYFVNKGSKFRFFAQAVRDYGPIVAVQMANVYFRYGGYDVPIKDRKTEFGDNLPPKGASSDEVRNWAINRLEERLPTEQSLEARAKPPSEGFILDKDGNIIAHGVGRGIDHFLPFSARHLRKLRKTEGGEFIRRRMIGGPTVEDLHAAMMMGADRLTVVSNGGTFTVELTGRSHGLRLEHMQVLGRFQAIMDREEGKNNGDRDHGVYERAMSLIQDEFPLHFRTSASREGADWADKDDYIQPRKRFRDQVRELFDAFTDDKTGDTEPTQRRVKPKRSFNPYQDNWQSFVRQSEADELNALRYVRDRMRALNIKPDQALLNRIKNVERLRGDSGEKRPSAQQRAAPVAPRDPALTHVQRGDTVDWSRFEDEAAVADDLGIQISTRSGRQGERVLEVLGKMGDNQLAKLANNPSHIQERMADMEDLSELPGILEELAGEEY